MFVYGSGFSTRSVHEAHVNHELFSAARTVLSLHATQKPFRMSKHTFSTYDLSSP